MTRQAPTIPNYNLFGEADDLPDVVHCETIEARSRMHDWSFAAHRHARLHQILFLRSGAGRASLDGQDHPLVPPLMINVPMGLVHGFEFARQTRGLVVTLAAEMLDQTLRPAEGLQAVLSRAAVMAVPAGSAQVMAQIATTHARRDYARAQILRSLAGLLLGQIARALAESGAGDAGVRSDLLARFETLIDAHYADNWSVSDYARALAVSSGHLTRVTRMATGRPASDLIVGRIIREARRNLVYTDLPVSRIAYNLGFEDPAYFSRVFARATGISPRAFRNRLGDGGHNGQGTT